MKSIYIVGIGGAGTSALARIYKERGYDVTGSDEGDGFYVNELIDCGVSVFDKFDANHITDDFDLVIYTTAVKLDNIELQRARELSLEILSYPEAIGILTKEMKTIAICGTHGKTSTTALTAFAFIESGFNPVALVGSKINDWGSGAYVGDGDYFLLEADEYQDKLAQYNPHSVILTSVDFDHPDFFENFEIYKKTFSNFVAKIPEDGFLVAYGDDDDVRDVALSAKCQVFFYGERELNNCRITNREVTENGQEITVKFRGEDYEIKTQLVGLHNAKNVVAAWLMNLLVTKDVIAGSIGVNKCTGTSRRFERKGMFNGAVLIDDYAHHPEEVSATLKTVNEIFKDKKIIAAFHPHTFSRTEALLEEFAQSLSIVDEVIVLDIFASARETVGSISSQDLVDKVNCDKKQNIHTVDELANWMKENLTENDVFITLGAGDIWKVYEIIKK